MFDSILNHPLLVILAVIVSGHLLGRVSIKSVSLGSSGILFTALLAGHFGYEIPESYQTLGLALFMWAIGLQAAPGFFSSFQSQGLKLCLTAFLTVFSGFCAVLVLSWTLDLERDLAVGLFAGALTSTPGLAVATELTTSTQTSAAYGVTYLGGVLLVVLMMRVVPALFRIDLQKDADALDKEIRQAYPPMVARAFRVNNPNLYGRTVGELNLGRFPSVTLTRIRHACDTEAQPVLGDTVLLADDIVRAVGTEQALREIDMFIGDMVEVPERELEGMVISRRIVVSKEPMVGRSLGSLSLREIWGVTVSRVARGGLELPCDTKLRFRLGDVLTVVGPSEGVLGVAALFGDNPSDVQRIDLMPLLGGLCLGILLGAIKIPLPGIGDFELGMTGGILLAALMLGAKARTRRVHWLLPQQANVFLRDMGLVFFLASVGTKAGATFGDTLAEHGTTLLWAGLIVSAVPMCIGLLCARLIFGITMLQSLGVLSGAMTSTPGLAAITSMHPSTYPTRAYAVVYPFALVSMIVLTKLLLLIL